MGRKVVNPFKEQGLPHWIRYLVSGLIGFFIALLLLGGNNRGPSVDNNNNSNNGASLEAANPQLRKAKPVDEKFEEQYQNDDTIGGDDEEEEEEEEESGSRSGDEKNAFPKLNQERYLPWVRLYYEQLEFEETEPRHLLTPSILEESLSLGCDYMVANQKPGVGNFNYQYDFVEQTLDSDDSPVRQAGALWGMALCFQSQPTNDSYRESVERGFKFFKTHMMDGPVPGSQMVKYPGYDESQSGVNALYGLALIDYIRTIRDNDLPEADGHNMSIVDLEDQLAMTIRFLKFMQNKDLHFSEAYYFRDEEKTRDFSPYYDGETLLCLVKAARYMDGYSESLVPIIEQAAPVIAKYYTLDAWREDEHDSDDTKGFYQWSSMAFTEYYFAKWEDYEYFGDLVLLLAHWIVHTHEILLKNLNTGYAFEGIISAYRIAQARGHAAALSDLEFTIDEGLYNLESWQVGGPLARINDFLLKHPTDEKLAVGGIMNAEDLSPLRIDTAQHQMHAVMMALETVYTTK